MKLSKLTDFDFQNKNVLVRCDIDVPLVEREIRVEDETRIKACLPTVEYLLEKGAKVILMGHLGRPEGEVVEELKMAPVAQKIKDLLKLKATSRRDSQNGAGEKLKVQLKIQNFPVYILEENLWLLENLRFYPGEEANDLEFAKSLSFLGDFYVNEAFAASHREHASLVGLPKFLPHCAGFHFLEEVENLSQILENPQRPLVFIIGGAKPETKIQMVAEFASKADSVLVGGTLSQGKSVKEQENKNVSWGDLTDDRLDINEETIEEFEEIIKTAGTIVWNGPLGRCEDEKWEAGTRKIAEAIAESKAFKVVGGGDTINALNKFGILSKMDFVSLGGGAMLEFLAQGTLPGIKALTNYG